MELREVEHYARYGLGSEAVARLATFGDLLTTSPTNVTGLREPGAIERLHFLDCLSLLDLPGVAGARAIIDVGSGGGLPAVVLATALPEARVLALESIGKKCEFVQSVARQLCLANLAVEWGRAEVFGQGGGREAFEVAVTRAVASLAVVAELSAPLVKVGGIVVAMKGAVSNEERIRGAKALAILGCDPPEVHQVYPFPGASRRWLYVARKVRNTPPRYPRKPGLPGRRPLG